MRRRVRDCPSEFRKVLQIFTIAGATVRSNIGCTTRYCFLAPLTPQGIGGASYWLRYQGLRRQPPVMEPNRRAQERERAAA